MTPSLTMRSLCAVFVTWLTAILAPSVAETADRAPLDVVLVVDVSDSLELSDTLIDAVEGLVRYLEPADRFGLYVFAQSICEETPLEDGDHARHVDRVVEVLRAFRGTPTSGGSRVHCFGKVGHRGRSAIFEALGDKSFAAGIGQSLVAVNVDERKRLILLVSDGFDDPDGWYVAGTPSSDCPEPRPGWQRPETNVKLDCLYREFQEGSMKYRRARTVLDQLMKVPSRANGRLVQRYFEFVLFWDWSSRTGNLLGEALTPAQQRLSAETVREFWSGSLLVRARDGQFHGQFLGERVYPKKKEKQLRPASSLTAGESSREVAEEVYGTLRKMPRRVALTVTCPSPPCRLSETETGAISFPLLEVEVGFESTYERELTLSGTELAIEGKGGSHRDPWRKLTGPEARLVATVSAIADDGKPGTAQARVPIRFWETDKGPTRFSRIRVAGRSKPDRLVLRDGPGPASKEYRFVPQEVNLEETHEGYDMTSDRRIWFTAGPKLTVALRFPRGITASEVVPFAAKPSDHGAKHRDFTTASEEPGCRQGKDQTYLLCSFVFATKSSIVAFTPSVRPRDESTTLHASHRLKAIVFVMVSRLGLVLALIAYVVLIALRWFRIHQWLPKQWLPESLRRYAGTERFCLVLEWIGFGLYLCALRFPLQLGLSEDFVPEEREGLEVLLGASWMMVLFWLVPFFALACVYLPKWKARRAKEEPKGEGAGKAKEPSAEESKELAMEWGEAIPATLIGIYTMIGMARLLVRHFLPAVAVVLVVFVVSRAAGRSQWINKSLDVVAALFLAYILGDTWGLLD